MEALTFRITPPAINEDLSAFRQGFGHAVLSRSQLSAPLTALVPRQRMGSRLPPRLKVTGWRVSIDEECTASSPRRPGRGRSAHDRRPIKPHDLEPSGECEKIALNPARLATRAPGRHYASSSTIGRAGRAMCATRSTPSPASMPTWPVAAEKRSHRRRRIRIHPAPVHHLHDERPALIRRAWMYWVVRSLERIGIMQKCASSIYMFTARLCASLVERVEQELKARTPVNEPLGAPGPMAT